MANTDENSSGSIVSLHNSENNCRVEGMRQQPQRNRPIGNMHNPFWVWSDRLDTQHNVVMKSIHTTC